jgi:hypothetical protein
MRYKDIDGRNPLSAVRYIYKSYKTYKAYRAYKAAQKATVVAGAAAALGSGSKYVYNYFVSGDRSEEVFEMLTQDVSPEYNNQRKREKDAKDKVDSDQAQTAKDIDKNITGEMPDGNPAPKRDPNDGGKNTKAAVGVVVVGGTVRAGLELTNPDPSKDAVEAHEKKAQKQQQQQQQQQNTSLWNRFINWLF